MLPETRPGRSGAAKSPAFGRTQEVGLPGDDGIPALTVVGIDMAGAGLYKYA